MVEPVSRRPNVRAAMASIGLVVAITSCGDATPTADSPGAGGGDSPAVIIATTSIWTDVAANVACGGLATVESIIPAGVDPHGFEPSPADRQRLDEALVVVTNGLGLEGGVADIVESAAEDGVSVFVATEHTDVLDGDPHIWFDPTRVIAVATELADELVDRAGLPRAEVDRCLTSYVAELADLDHDLGEQLRTVPDSRRLLVTNHDALGYLASHYGYEIIGTVLPSSSLGETSAQQLAELADILTDTGIDAVFTEITEGRDVIESLAVEVGDIEVVELYTDALGAPGSGADTYLGLMRTDAALIAGALG